MAAARRLDISLAIDPARARIWNRALLDELRRRGHRVSLALKPGGPRPPAAIELVQALEQFAGRARPGSLSSAWIDFDNGANAEELRAPDLVIDLTGVASWRTSPTLRPVFGDALVEEAAAASLLQRQVPRLGVLDAGAPSNPRMATPAIEHPHLLSRSLDNVGARMASLLAAATDDVAAGRSVAGIDQMAVADAHAWHRSLAAQAAVHSARLLLGYLLRRTRHWFVGWRLAGADAVWNTLNMPSRGWARMPDDGKRLYADPFVAVKDGRTWLFVEEVPYATQKGILSVVEMGPDGPLGVPEPFLERPGHLSYPFVFERDGATWMIPESSSEGTVDLYRADTFPHGWTKVATLIEGLQVGDATIAEHDGRLWLFGTVGGNGASTWDALHIWSADRLEGPWLPLGEDAVLVDAQSARPAGAFFRHGDALWRPAQDCTSGYGGALALCRVTKLGTDGFAQNVERVLRPGGAAWPGKGFHTLNFAGGIEVVDGFDER